MIELDSSNLCDSPLYNIKTLNTFPIVDSRVTYNDFFRNHLETNQPCIFNSQLIDSWLAVHDWVTHGNTPNVNFLLDNFGTADVPVANCDQKHYDSQKKETFKFQDYIKYWQEERNVCSLTEVTNKCLYLKDWHFVREFPNYKAYSTPSYFASDWLNEFWQTRDDLKDDYQFVYMGPKSSWTPFHADVFRSYSWSANICGRKKWIFYPPGEEQHLQDQFGSLIYDLHSDELKDSKKFPNVTKATGRLEVIQEKGEVIFVPSGWHHQVWNLEDTISINHNWINATNICKVWEFLVESLNQVEKAISDCREMEDWSGQCQLILKATHGMNFMEYYKFIEAITNRRIQYIQDGIDHVGFNGWRLGKNHLEYDANKLKWCLEMLLDDTRLNTIKEFENLPDNSPHKLLDKLTNLL